MSIKIYTTDINSDLTSQNNLLDTLNIPSLPAELRPSLEGELSLEENSNAIDYMKSGKAVGPDGLPIDIYKKFKYKIQTPLLTGMCC